MATLPPKLYFRIGEVAGLVGVEPHVLRYWEREFRSIRPTKSAKGQRVYSRRDVENLMRVRELLYADGFTIAGAKKKLQRSGDEAEERGSRHRANRLPRHAASSASRRAPSSSSALAERAEAAAAERWLLRFLRPPRARLRETLSELRTEIEAFLAELGG